MKTKQEIRRGIKECFSIISDRELNEKSSLISQKLYDYILWLEIKTIALYESLADEVDVGDMQKKLIKEWYSVLLPQMISETEMILIDSEFEVYEKEVDAFIVPGRAFTLDWKRLWRGKWYYDRFLSQKIYQVSQKIWICFEFQLQKEIPTQKHDISMNVIITND